MCYFIGAFLATTPAIGVYLVSNGASDFVLEDTAP